MNLARRILMARRIEHAVDEYWDDVVLLLKGDGPDGSTNITDSSVYGHPVTVYGNAQISTAQSVNPGGSSMYFDGAGGYLDLGSLGQTSLRSNNFTIECYFYLNSKTHRYARIFQFGTDPGSWNTQDHVALMPHHHDRGGKLAFQVFAHNGINFPLLLSNSVPPNGQWIHVAVSRETSTFRLFINGVLESSNTWDGSLSVSDTVPTYIGGVTMNGNAYLNGYIQDLRITKNWARYTADFTPPTEPFPTTGP